MTKSLDDTFEGLDEKGTFGIIRDLQAENKRLRETLEDTKPLLELLLITKPSPAIADLLTLINATLGYGESPFVEKVAEFHKARKALGGGDG